MSSGDSCVDVIEVENIEKLIRDIRLSEIEIGKMTDRGIFLEREIRKVESELMTELGVKSVEEIDGEVRKIVTEISEMIGG